MRLGGLLTGSDVAAGVAISLVSFLIAMALLHRLAVEELGVEAAHATVILLAFAPLSLFFTAVYTESLFLAVSVGAFYAARHGSWRTAALLAGAASATRVPGVFVIVGVAHAWWRSQERPRSAVGWLALSTLPLIAYSIYLDLHGFGLLASVRSEGAYGRSMTTPLGTIYDAIQATVIWAYATVIGRPMPVGIGSPLPVPIYNFVELIVLAISLVALVGVWRSLPRHYGLYATLVMIVCLWTVTPVEPLKSFDRYMLTLFPLWMVAGAWLARRRLLAPVLVLEIAGLLFYTHQFASWTFVA